MSPTVSRINLVSVLSVSIFKTCIIQREYKYKELQVQSLIFNKRIVREIWKLFDFERRAWRWHKSRNVPNGK